MRVRKVSGHKFAKWENVEVELPETGLVLITGKNGQGKSSLAEAVAQGVWNTPLTWKNPGWQTGAKSGVRVDFEGGHVRRSVAKSKHVLKWLVDDHGAGEYPTRTKSQTALESHVGSFHVWRHACTFHTKDAARFSEATDANRKRLLEEVLELDRVEAGYRKAREEVRAAKQELTAAEHAERLAEQEVTSAQKQIELMSGELEEAPDLHALRYEHARIVGRLKDLDEVITEKQAELQVHDEHLANAKATLRAAQRRREHFDTLGGAECPHCEQPVDTVYAAGIIDAAADEGATAQKNVEWYSSQRELFDSDLRAAVREQMELLQEKRDNEAEGKAGAAAERRNAERQAKLDALEAQKTDLEAALAHAKRNRAQAQTTVNELAAAASVLSYQGVRAALLDAAVRSLEELANHWLQRLGLANLRVEMSSQSEGKTGKVSDKISLDVHGAGGGHGYGNASTGQQRRLDIALLLAIGELAGQARGVDRGSTLFVDELFDGLDVEGTDAVCDMLREISQERCVVVITHSTDLIEALTPDLHLVVKDGELRRSV